MIEFVEFPKIARLNREIIITEKIDGTNAAIIIDVDENGKTEIAAASRSKIITIENDNHGFAKFVETNKEELINGLGFGYHYGEWYGSGIQRKYGLKEKKFSLFNTFKWIPEGGNILDATKQSHPPKCCGVVPILYQGIFSEEEVKKSLDKLRSYGSVAVPGFMNPEGIVIYHTASRTYYKVTLKDDESPKSLSK